MAQAAPTLEEVELALKETSERREHRLHHLFTRFDQGKTGALDRQQIEEGFRRLDITSHYKFARDLLEACDKNHDGKCDYREFRRYMDDKEVELYALFREIDLASNGTIYPSDLQQALKKAGIHLGEDELSQFVDHIDKDNNGIITFEEWRDFLLLYPKRATIASVYQYWEKVCQVDIGEQPVIPEGIRHQVDAWKYFLAGGVAGAVSRTATAPLDRLKVLLQVQTTSHGKAVITGVVGGFTHMYQEGGLLSYFRGNGINIIKVAPESAIKFYAYEMMKKFVVGNGSNGEIGPFGRLISGGVAGAIAQTIIYPLDLVKTRLQTYKVQGGLRPPPFPRLAADILRKEGVVAFYRGLTPSLIGMVPYAGLDLAAYETLKDFSRKYFLEGEAPGPLTQLACGTVSGAFGATAVYPLNVVRTRLQAQTVDSLPQYSGMLDVFRQTYQLEGLRGFYRGLLPNLLKVAPAASITYITYEDMKLRLGIQ